MTEEESQSGASEIRENQHRSLIWALLAKQATAPSPPDVQLIPNPSVDRSTTANSIMLAAGAPVSQKSLSAISTSETASTTSTRTTATGGKRTNETSSTESKPSISIATSSSSSSNISNISNISSSKKQIVTAPPKKRAARQNIDATSRRALALQHQWEDMFQRLMVYKSQHGDCLVPNRYSQDRQLGAWVSTQRRNFGKGVLSPQRKARLDAMGFVWKTSDPRATPWMQRYDELVEFYKMFGHSIVPILFDANRPLANWVSCQRQEYRYFVEDKPSRMTPERIKLLNEVDFVWDALRHRAPAIAPKVSEESSKKQSEESKELEKERATRKKKEEAKRAELQEQRQQQQQQRQQLQLQQQHHEAAAAAATSHKTPAAPSAEGPQNIAIMIHVNEQQQAAEEAFRNAAAGGAHAMSLLGNSSSGGGPGLNRRRTFDEAAMNQLSTNGNRAQRFDDQHEALRQSAIPQAAVSSASIPSADHHQAINDRQNKKNKPSPRPREVPSSIQNIGQQSSSPPAILPQQSLASPMPVTSTVISISQQAPNAAAAMFYQQQHQQATPEPTAIYVPHNGHPSLQNAFLAQQQAVAAANPLLFRQQQQQAAALSNPHLAAAAAAAAEQHNHHQRLLRNHAFMNAAAVQHQQQHNAAAAARAMYQQQQQQQHQAPGATGGLARLDAATILHLQRGGALL